MTTTARPRQMRPLTPTAGSLREISGNDHLRRRYEYVPRNVVPVSDHREENNKVYRHRIGTLLGHASEEGITARDESVKDFNLFVDIAVPTDKAMLIIMDNGNLRATWREGLSRLSLEFTGDLRVRYVVFIPSVLLGASPAGAGDQSLERSGECSFGEIRTQIKDWKLWDMVAS